MPNHSLSPRLPNGLRIYAIGDIHGRLDLLRKLLQQINQNISDNTPAQLIFLGDFIDRGLESRGVIDQLLALQAEQIPVPAMLLGNHDQVFRNILNNADWQLAANWLEFGGQETALSYGVMPPQDKSKSQLTSFVTRLQAAVPPRHLAFFNSLPSSLTLGDYFFCHAGIRPGQPLHLQSEDDLTWSRTHFIGHMDSYEKIIVHGHTISEQPELLHNRIGIDTGAYATGRLTALGLERDQQWIIHT